MIPLASDIIDGAHNGCGSDRCQCMSRSKMNSHIRSLSRAPRVDSATAIHLATHNDQSRHSLLRSVAALISGLSVHLDFTVDSLFVPIDFHASIIVPLSGHCLRCARNRALIGQSRYACLQSPTHRTTNSAKVRIISKCDLHSYTRSHCV